MRLDDLRGEAYLRRVDFSFIRMVSLVNRHVRRANDATSRCTLNENADG